MKMNPCFHISARRQKKAISESMNTFMTSITTAIFTLKIRHFLIAQQIGMAIVNTKAMDIFVVIVPRNLNVQKAKNM